MPKSVDPIERRMGLIAAGWELIAREGLETATMRRVAAEAGCTTGMLTHYFADRQSLLVAALRGAHRRTAARMLLAASRAKDDFDRLKSVVMESLPLDEVSTQEWRIWLAFWGASMSNSELAEENQNRYTEWRGMILTLLSTLILDEAEAKNECDLLIAVIDGLGISLARHTGEGDDALQLQQQQCRIVITRHLEQLRARAK